MALTMLPETIRNRLATTWPFGCLFTVLLGLGMAFTIFVGSVMGDCEPGPGCHDRDGLLIFKGWFLALPIVISFGAVCWLVFASIRTFLADFLGVWATNILFSMTAVALAWFGLDAAFGIFFWFSAPA
ncbi:hypothetical protein FHS91_000885 [Sphingobium xanthum]|jgi:hypothetical protein|uniref:hypothetical protein n=1 Tax=Sphingobium xanthum TaxID=1387165 RepID=UPI001C8C6E46|nr:hypothetical protein [Sphingobium xanthum]